MPSQRKKKRLNLALPEPLYEKLASLANERDVTVTELLRAFIKLGLVIIEFEDKEQGLYMKEEDTYQKVILITSF